MEVFLIYKDNVIIGFCNTEEEAKKEINNMVKLEINKMKEEKDKKFKIFTEKIENGKKIYIQELGNYINGCIEEWTKYFYISIDKI
jgi:hypothetical protein